MSEPWETPYPGSQPAKQPEPWETPFPSDTPQPNSPEAERDVAQHVLNSPGVKDAQNPWEAFTAGLQMSASVIPFHKPSMALDTKSATFLQKMSFAIGESLGDLPVALPAGVAAAAGSTPATGETGVGPFVAAGAAGSAVPQAVRETMMDYYGKGDRKTWGDFASAVAQNAWNVTKAGASGAFGGLTGGAGGSVAESLGGSAFTQSMARISAFALGTSSAASALDGHMPDAEDFATATILGLGLHAAGAAGGSTAKAAKGVFQYGNTTVYGDENAFNTVRNNMENIYRQTGTPPWEQAKRMKEDPKFRDEVLAHDVNGDPTAPKFNATREPEVEPFKTNAHKVADEHAQDVQNTEGEAFVRSHVEKVLPMVRALEGSGDDAVSVKGAVGRYQIMPGTARQYGFDPARLSDPAYNEMVARHVLTDLTRRFHGDTEAMLIAYNAGPGRAFRFLRDGRDYGELPKETQKYLIHAHAIDGDTAGSGGGKPPEPPDVVGKTEPEENGEEPPDWGGVSDEALRSRFENRIGDEPTREKSARSGLEFELTPAREVDQVLKKQGLLDPERDVGVEDMFRMTYGSENRAMHFFKYGPIDAVDPAAKVEGVSLKSVADEIDKQRGTRSDFNRYVLSQRSIEKMQQGIDMGLFKPGEAEENVSRLAAKYEGANKIFQQFNDSAIKYARDSGGFSDAQVNAMKGKNLSYMSIRRIMGDDAPFNIGGKGKFARNSNPLRAMEGSKRDIVDPWAATVDNVRQLIRFADRNRAIGSIIGSQEVRGLWGLKQIAQEHKAMIAEPGSDVFKPYSMSPEQEQAVAPLAIKAKGVGPNNFVFYRNGKPELWEAKDPDLARLIRGADNPGEASWLMKIMSFPATIDRAGVVGAPDFGLRVGLRHQLTAWVADPLHPPPYVTMMRGFAGMFGKGDDFQEMLRTGGFTGSLTDMDKSILKTDTQDLFEKTGVFNKMWNVVRHPLQAAQLVTETMTGAARMGYVKHAKAQGLDPFKATMMGRNAYLDYDEKMINAHMNAFAKIVPFFRPAALGIRFTKDAVVNHPGKTAAFVGAMLGFQTAIYALNRAQDKDLPDGQKYTDLPQWDRDNYFISPQIGPLGHRIRLAKPYVIGPMFGVPWERFLESTIEKDPHAWDGVAQAMGNDALPSLIPAVAKPVLEDQTNYNFYTGHPLVSDSLKANTRDMQYTENTTEIAKKVSNLLGGHSQTGVGSDSPPVLENYVREWSGMLGTTALHLLSTPFKQTQAPSDIADTPFLRSFIVRNPGMGAKPIDDFYKDAAAFEAQNKDAMKELKEGNEQQAIQDHGEAGAKAAFSMRVQKAFGVMRAAIHAINANDKMNDDEKRQLQERIYEDAVRIGKYGSQVLRGGAVSEDEAQALAEKSQGDITAAVPGGQ